MKAIRIHSFGGPESLRLEQLDTPQPRAGELLVKVQAASVNPVDFKIREGKYPPVKAESLPLVLGRDIAGVVEACGEGMALEKGAAVYAMLGMGRGGYEEYAIVQQDEAARMPGNLSFVEAAAVPLAGLTAWQGLFDHGGLQEGQRVLIHGAAGGVGHFALQFAKAKGAWAAVTVSSHDLELVRELGADQIIDYKSQRFEQEISEIDLVFDLIGGDTLKRSWSVLRDGGALISTLEEPRAEEQGRGLRGARFTAQPSGLQLAEIGRLIEAGKVLPLIQNVFPLDQAAAAQTSLEKDHVRGKIVLEVAA